MSAQDTLNTLLKALEAGQYSGAPGSLTNGSALMTEDLSAVMHNVTFEEKHIKLQRAVGSRSVKSMLVQFNRQLSYGQFGGSAQSEGNVGQEEDIDVVRATVPMTFYSHVRRVSIAANMVNTMDGKSGDDRMAEAGAKKIAADIEFDAFRGLDDFSNGGVFDGNPLTIPALYNMHGIGLQVRQSDTQMNTQDQMFAEFGSSESVVISGGGVNLTQDKVEDAALRSALNFGSGSTMYCDPTILSGYNKIALGKERIILAGSAQGSTGADLGKQWVSGGTVSFEASNFLRGKAKPQRPRSNGPAAPTIALAAAAGGALAAGTYTYYVTSGNEIGESPASAAASQAASANDKVTVTITAPGSTTVRFYNVYRSAPGGTAASAKFIGRVKRNAVGTTDFVDLGNRAPGASTAFLLDHDTMEIAELAPYSRTKLARTDLSDPEAHFRFCSMVVTQPRKSVLVDSLKGAF